MDVAKGKVARGEIALVADKVGEGFGYIVDALKQSAHQSFDEARRIACLAHLLGERVIGLHTHTLCLHFLGRVNVRLRHVDTPVEHVRFAEDDIFFANLIVGLSIFASCKPCEVHYALAVGEVCHHALLSRTCLECLKPHDMPFYLDIRHFGGYFPDTINLTAVDIFIRKI